MAHPKRGTLCKERGPAKCFLPPPGDKAQPVPKPCLVLIAAQPLQTGTAEGPRDKGQPSGAGKRGDTSRIASKVTSNHSHCPYPTDIFFSCLFYGKDLKLNFVSWSMKDVSENTEEPPPHVALIKEKRET